MPTSKLGSGDSNINKIGLAFKEIKTKQNKKQQAIRSNQPIASPM